MFDTIRTYLKTRREARSERRWISGYDYAAGALLRGTDARDLEYEMAQGFTFDEETSFDRGMQAALNDWQRRAL